MSDVGDRPRIGLDPPDQGSSSRRGQPGVSVRHEASELSAVCEKPAAHSEASSHVNNLHGQYS
jgi:hypothetical protein